VSSKLTVIAGRRGKGKSSLAYSLASRDGRGVVVFDPTESFGIGTVVRNADAFETALDGETSPVVFQIEDAANRPDAVIEDCAKFVSTVKHYREISVIIDESSYLQSPQWIAPGLDDEIRVGRRREHEVYITLHRMGDCNGILLDLVTDFKFFVTKNPRSLARIAEYCGDKVAGRVSQLKDFEFLDYDVDRELWCINNAPEAWRVNISGRVEMKPALPPKTNSEDGVVIAL
jgi:hypothetical protein